MDYLRKGLILVPLKGKPLGYSYPLTAIILHRLTNILCMYMYIRRERERFLRAYFTAHLTVLYMCI